jgi:hypothetical protein
MAIFLSLISDSKDSLDFFSLFNSFCIVLFPPLRNVAFSFCNVWTVCVRSLIKESSSGGVFVQDSTIAISLSMLRVTITRGTHP